jgi:hypothetical protein
VPTSHAWQVSDEFAAIAVEYDPAPQGTHVETETAPTSAEYVPAGHSVCDAEPCRLT